ncbi:MAG: hypothetical protein KH321_11235, partial [Clostridium sp.]|nr:hypothetical protein [Clostridium sp.]
PAVNLTISRWNRFYAEKSIMTPAAHNACSKIFGVFHLLYFDPKTDPNILYAVHKLTNVKIKKQRNIAIIVRFEYI